MLQQTMSSARRMGAGHGSSRGAGLPCPRCTTTIAVDPMLLLSAGPLECPSCGLVLRVDPEKSAAALDALHGYMRSLERATVGYERSVAGVTGERGDDVAPARKPRGRREPRRRSRRKGRSSDTRRLPSE